MDAQIDKRLSAIEEKLQRLVELVEGNASRPKINTKKRKEKPAPLTEQQIHESRALFSMIFERWMAGDEIQVHDDLEAKEIEDLRQFADANNLNVTSKMSKSRILELIAARFREKRQLHKPPVTRG